MTTSAVTGLSGGLYIGSVKIAECLDATLTIDQSTQDATNADGAGWEECVAGTRKWDVKGGFNLVTSDAGFGSLQASLLGGTTIASFKSRSTSTGVNWSGTVLVTQGQFKLFDLKNPQKVSWTLKGTGACASSSS
jgi:hypothetical protein